MNPLTNVKNISKLNELELARGTVDKKSWHDMYKESAWIFIGGLAYGLTEGDILSVFSQYGEIVNINLVRDTKTGKIKGFCFLCYANQKSTVLAVDNFNGIKLCGRTIRVDHVANYKPPKEHENDDDLTKQLKYEGCAPKPIKLENAETSNVSEVIPEKKKSKKAKKERKKNKKKRKHDESNDETYNFKKIKVKEEKIDAGYSKNELLFKEKDPKRKVSEKKRKHGDSSDTETSSSDSDSSDCDSHNNLWPRKEKTNKHKVKQSDQNYKEKHRNHKKYETKISNDKDSFKSYKTAIQEKGLSSSDSDHESGKQKQLQNDYLNNSSSRSKSYGFLDRSQERNPSDEDYHRYRSDSHQNSKMKHSSSEYKKLVSKHHRDHSGSSSEREISDKSREISDKSNLRVRDKENEKQSKRLKKHDKLEGYSQSQKSYEGSSRRRDDKDYSSHERDH